MIPHEPHRWAHPNAIQENLIVKPIGDIATLRQKLPRHAELGVKVGSTGARMIHVQLGRAESLADELLKAGLVEYAQPDMTYHAQAIPSDTLWRDSLADCQHGWDLQKGGSVSVAVLDTGCNKFTDFGANVLSGWNVLTSSTNVTDTFDHGTACCSLIAADTDNGSTGAGVAGMGWGIKVVPIKIGTGGTFTDANITAGITWVVANSPAKIISMSFSGTGVSSQALIDEIAAAWSAGLILCAAAGNNDNSSAHYPAANANCVAVCGTPATSNDRYLAGVSGGSNYGSWTDTAGHYGVAVSEVHQAYDRNGALVSPGAGGFQGTSAACPALCALLAIMWGYKPTATNTEILDAVINNGDLTTGTDWGSPNHPAKALNFYRAINSLRSDTPRGFALATGGF